jgi:hypothetical protein
MSTTVRIFKGRRHIMPKGNSCVFGTMPKKTVSIMLAALFTVMACGSTSYLRSKIISPDTPPAGQFDLILYTSLEDEMLLKIAVLDFRGDSYRLLPYAAEFNFKTFEGLEAEDAINRAKEFFRTMDGYNDIELHEIKGPEGGVVAIEIRPLFDVFVHGTTDIINTNYYVHEEGTIKFVVGINRMRKLRRN